MFAVDVKPNKNGGWGLAFAVFVLIGIFPLVLESSSFGDQVLGGVFIVIGIVFGLIGIIKKIHKR